MGFAGDLRWLACSRGCARFERGRTVSEVPFDAVMNGTSCGAQHHVACMSEPSPEPARLPSSSSQLSKRLFKELSCLSHMFFNI